MVNGYSEKQKELIDELEKSFAAGTFKPTIVDMQQDYVHDDNICLTSVVFIPDDLSQKIIEDIINPLKDIEPQHYYYSAGSLHITIKNIRTVHKPPLFTPSDVKKAQEVFEMVVSTFPAFKFTVEDVLAFPTSAAVMGYSDDALQKLVVRLDEELKKAGVPDNKQYLSDSVFWGNVTVCRFVERPGEKFMAALKKMRNLKIGTLTVNRIDLITCNVGCSPNSKTLLAEYRLS